MDNENGTGLTCDQKAHHLHSSLECPVNPNGRKVGVMELRGRFWNEMGYEGLHRNAQQFRDKLAHIHKSNSIETEYSAKWTYKAENLTVNLGQ